MNDLVTQKKELHETSWLAGYKYFSQIINEHNLKTGAEIGVAFGGHSEAILRQTEVHRLYGVDEYRHRRDYSDPMNLTQKDFEILFQRTKQRLSQFGDRFVLVRAHSTQAVNEIAGFLDFVYIDADHSYEGVARDLRSWYPKIRVGGVIGGHDYDHPNFPGVRKAIDEFFGRLNWEVYSEGEGVWWVRKEHVRTSFFIPAFNCELTVSEAVESILKTNFEDGDELIVVNDGSADGTVKVLDGLSAAYGNLRILSHQSNKGGAATRNTCIENATNQILFCLDSDNVLPPRSAKPLKEFMVVSGADIATFQEVRYFEKQKDNVIHKWKYKTGVTTLADYLAGHVHAGSSGNYMFTKQSWVRAGGYPEFAGALDTWGFGLRQLATGSVMQAMPGSYYLHRQGHESYWIRDSRGKNLSAVALQVLLPYRDLIQEKDIKYITGPKGKDVWFDRLSRHPIRLKRKSTGRTGVMSARPSMVSSLARIALNKALAPLTPSQQMRAKAFLRTLAK